MPCIYAQILCAFKIHIDVVHIHTAAHMHTLRRTQPLQMTKEKCVHTRTCTHTPCTKTPGVVTERCSCSHTQSSFGHKQAPMSCPREAHTACCPHRGSSPSEAPTTPSRCHPKQQRPYSGIQGPQLFYLKFNPAHPMALSPQPRDPPLCPTLSPHPAPSPSDTHREMTSGGRLRGTALESTQKAVSRVQEQLRGQGGSLGPLLAPTGSPRQAKPRSRRARICPLGTTFPICSSAIALEQPSSPPEEGSPLGLGLLLPANLLCNPPHLSVLCSSAQQLQCAGFLCLPPFLPPSC